MFGNHVWLSLLAFLINCPPSVSVCLILFGILHLWSTACCMKKNCVTMTERNNPATLTLFMFHLVMHCCCHAISPDDASSFSLFLLGCWIQEGNTWKKVIHIPTLFLLHWHFWIAGQHF